MKCITNKEEARRFISDLSRIGEIANNLQFLEYQNPYREILYDMKNFDYNQLYEEVKKISEETFDVSFQNPDCSLGIKMELVDAVLDTMDGLYCIYSMNFVQNDINDSKKIIQESKMDIDAIQEIIYMSMRLEKFDIAKKWYIYLISNEWDKQEKINVLNCINAMINMQLQEISEILQIETSIDWSCDISEFFMISDELERRRTDFSQYLMESGRVKLLEFLNTIINIRYFGLH